MSKEAPEAPLARLALVFHAPTIASVEVVYRPAAGRLARALASLLLCWGAIPILLIIPPHYPWPAIAFAAGLYLCYRSWTGRYLVRSFSGFCPRCARPLHLPPGSKIDLPHTLTCFGCHFDPILEAALPNGAEPEPDDLITVDHRFPECVGRWRLDSGLEPAMIACDRCRARHCATPVAWEAAQAENERAELMDELAGEGRFLL